MPQLEGDQQLTADAADCADMMAILNDIHHSNSAARIFLSGKYAGDKDNQVTRKSLYESALISFRRALRNGSSRIPGDGRPTWKIPNSDFDSLIGENRNEYNELIRLADKCVAHRVAAEAGLAEVVKNAPVGQPHMQIKYTEKKLSIVYLFDLTNRMKDYLGKKMVEKSQSIQEGAESDS